MKELRLEATGGTHDSVHAAQNEAKFCVVRAEGRRYAVASETVLAAGESVKVRRVPLSADFVAGLVAFRGDLLTAICLRARLGMERGVEADAAAAVVLQPDGCEPFVLLVDEVENVVTVEEGQRAPAPATLSDAEAAVVEALYRESGELGGTVLKLREQALEPGWILQEATKEKERR